MTDLFTVTDAGLRVATLAEAKEKFDDLNKEFFGSDIDLHSHTPQNQIAGINAQIWHEVGDQILRTALYGSSVNHAPGRFLDAFGSLLDIPRKFATYTKLEAVMKGSDGVTVTAGSLIQSINGDQFSLEEDVVLTENGVIGKFVALEPGAIPAPAGGVNQIVSVEDIRWKSVNNPNEGIIGQNEESDSEYRANIKKITALSAVSTISSLESIFSSIGANKINILENSTSAAMQIQNIAIPSRSLMAIVDGGITNDLQRAYELRRPLGVSTRGAVFSNKEWTLNDTTKIGSGAFRFNNKDFTNINLGVNTSLSAIATTLNGLNDGPDFVATGNILMAMYDWTPKLKGFEQITGNESEVEVKEGMKAIRADVMKGGDKVRVVFNELVGKVIAANSSCTYTTPSGETTITSGNRSIQGDSLVWLFTSDLPDDITDFKITVSVESYCSKRTADLIGFDVNVHDEVGANSAPLLPHASVVPGTNKVTLYSSVFGTVTGIETIRFDGVEFIDKDAQGNREWQYVGTSSTSGQRTFSGYTTNRNNCQLSVRYKNGNEYTDEISLNFSTSNIKPAPVSATADGNEVIIKTNSNLNRYDRVNGAGLSNWDIRVSGTRHHVLKQINCDERIFLFTGVPFNHGDQITISYTKTSGAIKSFYGEASSFSLSTDSVENITKQGLPASPFEFVAAGNMNNECLLSWGANSNGGDAVDSYEYTLSYDEGKTWQDWLSLPHSTYETTVSADVYGRLPNKAKVRASNPNTRILKSLGFDGAETLTPIVRPVEKSLRVQIQLANVSELVGDSLTQIKNAIISRVNLYGLGETIWTNDLLATAELINGVRITSLTAQHGGVSVNDVAQEGFIRWTLEAKDITFS